MRAPHLLTLLLTAAGLLTLPDARAREIRNVILFIGDGMGSEHLHATERWTGAPLGFRSFPAATTVTTFAARGVVTDSAAAATAMATGRKVNRFVLSQARPGNGADVPTVLEILRRRGKRTGLVTTAFLTDATPAAFGAHEASRVSLDRIAADYLNGSRPDLLLGGGGFGMSADAARRAGYQVVTNRTQFMALTAGAALPVAGLFGSGRMPYEYDGLGALPRLTDMTSQALALLSNAPSGFFLMIEGALIDKAAEQNDLARCLHEVREFGRAVDRAVAWAGAREDTLILVTADHETGGLRVMADRGPGQLPQVTWATTNHTSTPVPLYARGTLAEAAQVATDNTDLFGVMLADVPGWYSRTLAGAVTVWADHLGLPGGAVVPGDYDDNGTDDLAVFHARSGSWFIRRTDGNVLAWPRRWGFQQAAAVPGDYDGDGADDLALYHPEAGRWYIQALDQRTLAWDLAWGYAGTRAVPGDYDNDTRADLAVYDETAGRWYIRSWNGALLAWNLAWGGPGLRAVAGDYDGDGRHDLAVQDRASGRWYVRRLNGDVLAWGTPWGYAGAEPVSGDFDGDGADDLMVYDPERGAWYGRALDGRTLAWDERWGFPGSRAASGDFNGDRATDLLVVEMP